MPTTSRTITAWPIVPLVSEVKFLSGGTPTMAEAKYWNGDIPWVSSGEMTRRKIRDTRSRVTEVGAKEGSKRIPARTVLVVIRGMSLAKEFRVAITARDATFNQDLKALLPSKKLIPEFLFYYLLSQNHPIRDSASESAHGTKKLDTQVLEEWPLPLPSRSIQSKISAILSAYDELIENNEQRIALLEMLAEEIYREWFVRLRFAGHEKVRLDNRPLRAFISEYVGGDWGEDVQSPKFGNPVYVIRGTDFESVQQGDISSVPLRFIKDSGLRNRKLKAGDLIVENSVNHQSRTSGKSMLVTQHVLDLFDGDVICASFCKLIRPKDTTHSKFLALNFRLLFKQGLFDYFQNIATNGIANLQAERLMDRHLIPFHDGIDLSIFESLDTSLLARAQAKLKETRDKLLPRLISGKLSVENLDIQFPPGMAEELRAELDIASAKAGN